jgi:hypothetical protein
MTKTDLFERYLGVLAWQLPAGQRDDIKAELRDELLSRQEERERALGRELTLEEREEILREFGHPMSVAARYRPRQALIGGEVLPVYEAVLTAVLAIVVAVEVVAAIIDLAAGGPFVRTVIQHMWGVINGGFYVVGMTTVAFAVLQRVQKGRLVLKWRPRELPEPLKVKERGRFNAAFELAFGAAFALAWGGVITLPGWGEMLGYGNVALEPAPVWATFHLPILALLVLGLVMNASDIVRPQARRSALYLALKGVQGVAMSVLAALLLRSEPLFQPGPLAGDERYAGFAAAFPLAITIALLAIMVVGVFEAAGAVWGFARRRQE